MGRENQYGKDPFKRSFDNLETFVDKIRDVLECPVTIEDANHRLLAYSTHDDQTDQARIATIISRKVPEKVINSLWKADAIPQLLRSAEPLKIPEIKEIGLGNRVAISIRHQEEVLGYIWVVERDKSLTAEDMYLLKLAAQSARIELLKLYRQKKKREESYQDFFWQLLTGRYPKHAEVIDKLDDFHIKPSLHSAVIIFRFIDDIDMQTEQSMIYLISTSQKIHMTFYATMGNDFILLASPPSTQANETDLSEFVQFVINQMYVRFEIDHIISGSSSLKLTYDHVEDRYSECLEVLRLKSQYPKEMQEIYTYHQLGVFKYLDAILDIRSRDAYEHPVIQRLIDYDHAHRTELLMTLEAFILNDSNVNDAAKVLHVHVNTLNYRLKRITELTHVNFKSTHEKFSLYLELQIRKYIEKKHRL
ncbi:PucR family transcriptional regulator [Cytobacillus kochii]|uniref:PucR family transcriptional regulator n=1 Tax=Cytobacillus kochii TaxID=859143 RepID=A0A248TJU0_9BACI|nr:helix-turn-helix domain-containing protein [Cytobacillus kochii]ASV68484.1 PucR family transcriptional regulator [Cytobacillus kochii]